MTAHFRPAVYDLPRDGHTVFRWEHPPQQATVELERRQRKQSLAAAFRVFARLGFDMGGAGHITVRDPGRPDHFWVNPVGVYFGHVRVSDLLLVNPEGAVIEGEGALNLAAFAIHAALHEAHPEVVAAAHAHSLHGKAWSSLGRLLDPLTQDACAFYERHGLFDNFSGVVLEASDVPGILATDIHADGKHAGILCVPGHVSGGKVLGDPLLKMDGQAVFKLAVGVLEDTARAVLTKSGRSEADIDWLIPHQANIRIMQSTARKLKLPMDKVVVTVDQHGNTSAASIPLALDHAVRAGQVKKGDTLMLEGVGGGFTWGAVLLDF